MRYLAPLIYLVFCSISQAEVIYVPDSDIFALRQALVAAQDGDVLVLSGNYYGSIEIQNSIDLIGPATIHGEAGYFRLYFPITPPAVSVSREDGLPMQVTLSQIHMSGADGWFEWYTDYAHAGDGLVADLNGGHLLLDRCIARGGEGFLAFSPSRVAQKIYAGTGLDLQNGSGSLAKSLVEGGPIADCPEWECGMFDDLPDAADGIHIGKGNDLFLRESLIQGGDGGDANTIFPSNGGNCLNTGNQVGTSAVLFLPGKGGEGNQFQGEDGKITADDIPPSDEGDQLDLRNGRLGEFLEIRGKDFQGDLALVALGFAPGDYRFTLLFSVDGDGAFSWTYPLADSDDFLGLEIHALGFDLEANQSTNREALVLTLP